MKRWIRPVLVFLVLTTEGLITKGPGPAWSEPLEEYAVKAAFVYNFTKLTQWPETVFKSDTQPFNIAVFGNDHVKTLFKTLDGKTSTGRTIHIITPEPGTPEIEKKLRQCQIVFISTEVQSEQVSLILKTIKDQPVLSIGEEKSFSRGGGIIQFYKKNDRLHFEVNLDSAQAHQIKFSSRLLKLAVIVSDEK